MPMITSWRWAHCTKSGKLQPNMDNNCINIPNRIGAPLVSGWDFLLFKTDFWYLEVAVSRKSKSSSMFSWDFLRFLKFASLQVSLGTIQCLLWWHSSPALVDCSTSCGSSYWNANGLYHSHCATRLSTMQDTVDGHNPAITSWGKGSWTPIICSVLYMPGGWPWDFWTINVVCRLRFTVGEDRGWGCLEDMRLHVCCFFEGSRGSGSGRNSRFLGNSSKKEK